MKPPGIRCLCVVQFSACLFPDKFFDLAIESLVYKKKKNAIGESKVRLIENVQ